MGGFACGVECVSGGVVVFVVVDGVGHGVSFVVVVVGFILGHFVVFVNFGCGLRSWVCPQERQM